MNEFDKNTPTETAATEAATRQALDHAAQQLAAQHRQALAQARTAALARAGKPRVLNAQSGWIGFAVAASFGAFMLLQTGPQPAAPEATLDAAEHFAALSDLDELTELDTTDYEIIEDLDFAYWLSTQDGNVAPEAAHNG